MNAKIIEYLFFERIPIINFKDKPVYNSFSEEYDRFVNWKSRLDFEIPFLLEEIRKVQSGEPSTVQILDSATGTGMHAIALAQKGYSCWGVDLSAGMIEKARKNAAQSGVDCHFETAGFGELHSTIMMKGVNGTSFPAQFDVILCLGNSLPHINGPEELNSTLHDFADCLKPDGLLLIQNRNFDAVMASRERWMEPQSFIDSEGEWLYLRMYDFLPEGLIQFNIITLSRAHRTENWSQRVTENILFPILKNDLLSSLEATGFDRISLYGSLANTPFEEETSNNLVVTARKRKS